MIRLGLVDDEPLFVTGLAMILDSQEDMRVAWRAIHGQDALVRQRADPVDIILMDVQMPVMDGVEATRSLAEQGLVGRVIVLTTFDTDAYVLGAIDAGASGFLLKTTPPAELIAAIRTVAGGDAVISPGPTRRLLTAMQSGESSPEAPGPLRVPSPTGHDAQDLEAVESLTERETEVLALVAEGLTNQEICDRLWLSMPTVKTHVSHLLVKTGARDRVQLVLFALRSSIVSADTLLRRP